MITKLEQLVYDMLTEDTGRSFLDSGGDDGRHWQRNRRYTIEQFETRPTYEAEIYHVEGTPAGEYDISLRVDLFQYLTNNLELDDICNSFNAIEVDDWDSDEFMGCSADQEEALLDVYGLSYSPGVAQDSMPFNTYNFDGSPYSQCVQFYLLHRSSDGVDYVLLQLHNGADVRGGYTNAKLFRVDRDVDAYCLFCDDDYSDNVREEFNDYVASDGAERINDICGGNLGQYEGYLYYRDGEVYSKPYDYVPEAMAL